ncbi:peptidyl-prolyl cis-trans isomerase [Bradyrhizobium ontarionense]|uniref:peptidylprolyl isomerase n=2 Tax=Bradyrhizobium ontarionense TaxID=2898149 RepID=A0ABY3RIF8_9BRAD|nr:peptidylprolyl isomerase [Bradyrhizobium sp. A19]UFZ07131.1 peptidyl-prolyl cis-trans isomerase [Bradyrhizobium sp. A19]
MSASAMSNAAQTLDLDDAAARPAERGGNSDASAQEVAPSRARVTALRKLVREPLLHFLVLGGLIFAADSVLHPPASNEKVITVSKALRQSFIDNFDEDKQRTPSSADLQKMIDAWVASEILYREGKALGVDRGDEMIRDRVAFKLQLLIFDQVRVPEPTEAQLRAWFADNHARFDAPERVSFFMTPATDEATARQQLEDIRGQRESEELRDQTRVILGRPVASLAGGYGEGFRDGLLKMPTGDWSLLQSNDGWHVVRLDAREPGTPAKLEDVRDEAAKIWHTDETRRQAWDAVTRLKANYTIRYEP